MIRIGIAGYGNIGRGVEAAVTNAPDMEISAVFTRRDPASLTTATGARVLSYDDMDAMKDEVDVMIICAGSATDLPWMSPKIAGKFNIVDSYDNHAKIPEHFKNVDEAAKAGGNIGLISCGWDPGYFSISRLYAETALPAGESYTFWGRGVSQGHSDAVRRIDGVADARQYTVPVEEALDRVRSGEHPEFTKREMHLRECYVVAGEGADKAKIEEAIKTMPDYFEPYDTTVNFISKEEMAKEHSGLPHGGSVIRSGSTGIDAEFNNTVEFSLDLDSNPYFTASILAAAARAVYRLSEEGKSGAVTMFDIPPAYLYPGSHDDLLAHML